jgi:hypothetical protein
MYGDLGRHFGCASQRAGRAPAGLRLLWLRSPWLRWLWLRRLCLQLASSRLWLGQSKACLGSTYGGLPLTIAWPPVRCRGS